MEKRNKIELFSVTGIAHQPTTAQHHQLVGRVKL